MSKSKNIKTTEIKNSFGMLIHPTDSYIHWGEKNPEDKANKLRMNYDKIIQAGFKEELEYLLEEAYESGIDDENDNQNPDL